MAVEIQKKLCGIINMEFLIESTCFNLKISRFHVLFSFLVDSACFVMANIQKYFQSLRIRGFP